MSTTGAIQDVPRFVRDYLAPAITDPQDRLAAYRYAYSLAIANLNIDDGEGMLLNEMKTGLGLGQAFCEAAEKAVLEEYAPLHRALPRSH